MTLRRGLKHSRQLQQKKFFAGGESLKSNIQALAQTGQITGAQGELFPLFLNSRIILVTGLGKSSEHSLTALRIAVRKAILSSFLSRVKEIEIVPHNDND